MRQPDQAEDGPNRIAAGLFAIILGGLGAHKFYLGKPLLGVLYLFFVWTFIPSLVGIIEGLVYLSQSDREFRTRYG